MDEQYSEAFLILRDNVSPDHPGILIMKNILVVDNDQLILEFMKDLLSSEGHQVITAGDGLSALDVLKAYLPDVIFVDLVMPRIDGKTFLRIIRSMDKLRDTFCVIISSTVVEEAIDITNMGANLCIAKGPFNEMAGHVLDALDKSDLATLPSAQIIGVDDSYPKTATKELLSINRHFEDVLDRLTEGILEITSGGRIVYANHTAQFLIDIPEEHLLGRDFAGILAEDDQQRITELMKVTDGRLQRATEKSPVCLKNRLVTLDMVPIDREGSAILIVDDVTEQRKAEKTLRESEKKYRELSIKDELTGLYNSRYFYSQLEGEVARSERYGSPLTLLLLDLDNFKSYNDTYGHLEGDRLLRNFGENIEKSVRKPDSAYRYGGDEFTVILPETEAQEALHVANRVKKEFEVQSSSINLEGKMFLTVSIGVTQYLKGEGISDFVSRTDKNMYTAKSQGKDGIFCSK